TRRGLEKSEARQPIRRGRRAGRDRGVFRAGEEKYGSHSARDGALDQTCAAVARDTARGQLWQSYFARPRELLPSHVNEAGPEGGTGGAILGWLRGPAFRPIKRHQGMILRFFMPCGRFR